VKASPYEGYAVVRTAPAVLRVEGLGGPHSVDAREGMAPSDGWIEVLFWWSDQERALRVTTTDGATRQFFLRDAGGPCQAAPLTRRRRTAPKADTE
jgi:hypothetical protein